jgi:hypothetical protein
MINPDLDFELPAGAFPPDQEPNREDLPLEAQQWRSLYWARHGVPRPDEQVKESDLPRTEFRFPEEAGS